jgi:hypothetical protein
MSGTITIYFFHFELTLVQDERLGYSFSLMQVFSLFSAPCVEDMILSPIHMLGFFLEN